MKNTAVQQQNEWCESSYYSIRVSFYYCQRRMKQENTLFSIHYYQRSWWLSHFQKCCEQVILDMFIYILKTFQYNCPFTYLIIMQNESCLHNLRCSIIQTNGKWKQFIYWVCCRSIISQEINTLETIQMEKRPRGW